jgi:hypothetical protein
MGVCNVKDLTLDYFTERAVDWQQKAFQGQGMDPATRAFRTLEEAIEMCQAVGVSEEKCHEQVVRTYSRPVGDPVQEWAGTLFCHLLTGRALGLQPGHELNKEIDDAYVRMPAIIEKNKTKVKHDQ